MSLIPVSVRLPDHKDDVLVVFDCSGDGDLRYGIASLSRNDRGNLLFQGHGGSHNSVKFWAALPKFKEE